MWKLPSLEYFHINCIANSLSRDPTLSPYKTNKKMIKSLLKLKHHSPSRSFSTHLKSVLLVSATDKGGEGFTHSTQGHTSNTSRELSFEEQYAAKHDYELLKKLADLSHEQSKKVASIFDKIDESNRMNADFLNLAQNINQMKGIIDESLASTRVANVDVSTQQSIPEQTPWRTSQPTAQQPKTIENIENVSGATMGTANDQNAPHQTKFMDKSFYPDLTNEL